MKKIAFLLLFMLLTVVYSKNPLDFREYQQSLILTFQTEQDAEKAIIKTRPLPCNYKIAFSSRWDDTTLSHLKTHAVMVKNNMKGTFFLDRIDEVLQREPHYIATLLNGGCSLGVHTLSHPQLTGKNPHEQFREYMFNRIQIEVGSQSLVNAQVLPYMNWSTPDKVITASIGWAMRAAGVISSPDAMYPNREKELGYPEKSLALSRYLNPGDRNPDLHKLEKQLANALENKKALSIQPSLSMAMHSWHTPEGLINLDKAYKRVANNPEWWYCNQNEYGAYRYEAQNVSITKKIKGKNVEFCITRIMPFELGADVPLWFLVEGAVPVAISGAELYGKLIKLPHDKIQTLPMVFGYARKEGRSSEIPFATLVLRHLSEKKWTAEFKTLDGQNVEQLAFTFRFPSSCDRETVRCDAGTTADVTVSANINYRKKDLYYRYGSPYFAVQADFVRAGKRYRLYADLQEFEMAELPLTINDVARFFIPTESYDLAKLSLPSADLSAYGLYPVELKKRLGTGSGVIYPGEMNRKNWKNNPNYLAVIEFMPLTDKKVTIVSTVGYKWKKSELWLNGKKVNFENNQAELMLSSGINRFVLKAPCNTVHSIFLNGELEQCVEFKK